jgi:ribosomal protein L35AE/L33A
MNMIMPCSVDQGSFLAGEPQVQHGNEGNVPPMRAKFIKPLETIRIWVRIEVFLMLVDGV